MSGERSVSETTMRAETRENECAPKQRVNAAPGLAASDYTGGPLPIMLSSPQPVQTEARDTEDLPAGSIPPAQAVHVLQRLLAEALRTREQAIAEVDRLRSTPFDRHWYVGGDGGYCQACSLPKGNQRHSPRAVA